MSSLTHGTSAIPIDDKKKGLSRVFGRMKTVLRRSDGSRRLTFAGKASTTSVPKITAPRPPTPTPTPTPTPASKPTSKPKETPVPTGAIKPKQTQTSISPQPIQVSRAEINAERARKLGERFQLQIEAHEWQTLDGEKDAWRVEKPIRVRIHRTCHKCNMTFGALKICANCEHPRCTKCPRYPLKKKEKGKTAVAIMGPIPVVVEREGKEIGKLRLTLPSHKIGGQPLVKKKPMQRVRRTCHECSSLYLIGSKICATCSHTRCADCPRNPSKKKKYPDGYPGDQPSSITLKFACHVCDKTYPILDPEIPSSSIQECRCCKHVKCDMCKIALPRKVIPEPDPEVLERVEERLRGLSIRHRTMVR
ncbi:hypothetical protein SBOR_8706 [Sclerotinia borealis F-4128]|uniref:Uncharacterized protein n=1 Tax=Sclerotinia borealis (strain F-4128) TaxID=1432307 RepID=W9C8P2_SCLBF|nr:hypothetical protein SBOR_8706 [Sclerotinia borealis F-4128]